MTPRAAYDWRAHVIERDWFVTSMDRSMRQPSADLHQSALVQADTLSQEWPLQHLGSPWSPSQPNRSHGQVLRMQWTKRYCDVLLGLYLDLPPGAWPCLNTLLLLQLQSAEFTFASEHRLAEGGHTLSFLHLLRLAIAEEPARRKQRLAARVPKVWSSVKARRIKGPLSDDGTVAWSYVDAVASEICKWHSHEWHSGCCQE